MHEMHPFSYQQEQVSHEHPYGPVKKIHDLLEQQYHPAKISPDKIVISLSLADKSNGVRIVKQQDLATRFTKFLDQVMIPVKHHDGVISLPVKQLDEIEK
jgi:hypothetical protein